MSGFIAVNNAREFSMSSVYFDAIVNYSKPFLEELSPDLAREIYEPIEEAGLFVLGLTETSSDDFRLVFKALNSGFESCVKKGKCGKLNQSFFDALMSVWKEVLQAMGEDDRLHPAFGQ